MNEQKKEKLAKLQKSILAMGTNCTELAKQPIEGELVGRKMSAEQWAEEYRGERRSQAPTIASTNTDTITINKTASVGPTEQVPDIANTRCEEYTAEGYADSTPIVSDTPELVQGFGLLDLYKT